MRCQVGDLAIVVGLIGFQHLNGKIAEVLSPTVGEGHLGDWVVVIEGQQGTIKDNNLIPLRGNPDDTAKRRDTDREACVE